VLIWESFGAWLQAAVTPMSDTSRMTERYTEALAFIKLLLKISISG
jgi:hypothetical protein